MRKTLILAVAGSLALAACETAPDMASGPTPALDVQEPAGTTGPPEVELVPRAAAVQASPATVGMLGSYFAANMTAFLTANGHTVVTVTQPFIDGGGLATLDALYLNRGGVGTANSNIAAIENYVRGGGILITEFSATEFGINSLGFAGAGTLDVTFGVPSGTVCGGNTVVVTDPASPIAAGLPVSWGCSGDPIGVFKVWSNLDPNFNVVATVTVDQNSDGVDDPVVATSCEVDGVWVAFFTDFGDWQPLQNPRTCPFPPCNRSIEDESLMLNAVTSALGACVIRVAIDIKPGSFPNSINTKSMGVVPVAILGSLDFDVQDVDVATLEFGPAGATPAHDLLDPATYADHLQDVNNDGFLDLVSHYRQKDTGLQVGDTEACLDGATLGGTPIHGCDSVNIVN